MDLLTLSTHNTYNNYILVYDAVLSCKLLYICYHFHGSPIRESQPFLYLSRLFIASYSVSLPGNTHESRFDPAVLIHCELVRPKRAVKVVR